MTRQASYEAELVQESKWNKDHEWVAGLAKKLAKNFFGVHRLDVVLIKSPKASTAADYSKESKKLRFNISKLSKGWFAKRLSQSVLDLLVHELAHEYGGHLDKSYHKKLTEVAAAMTLKALNDPDFFTKI